MIKLIILMFFVLLSFGLSDLSFAENNSNIDVKDTATPAHKKPRKEREEQKRKVTLYDSGEFLSVYMDGETTKASYIALQAKGADSVAEQILIILKATRADSDFIAKAEERLPSNSRLQEEEFTLPLRYKNKVYRFDYFSEFRGGSVLNYELVDE